MKQLIENTLDRQERRLGPHSVVLGIHWQNDVVAPAGALDLTFAESVRQKGVIPRTAALFAHARASGALVVYVNVIFEMGYVGVVPNNALWNMVRKSGGFMRGSPGVDVVADLAPGQGDVVLSHSRISCFYGTELLTILIGHGITDVYLTGVATNVAVDHTARDSAQLGFNTFLVEDCCATSDERYHDAAMLSLSVICTDVVRSESLL